MVMLSWRWDCWLCCLFWCWGWVGCWCLGFVCSIWGSISGLGFRWCMGWWFLCWCRCWVCGLVMWVILYIFYDINEIEVNWLFFSLLMCIISLLVIVLLWFVFWEEWCYLFGCCLLFSGLRGMGIWFCLEVLWWLWGYFCCWLCWYCGWGRGWGLLWWGMWLGISEWEVGFGYCDIIYV